MKIDLLNKLANHLEFGIKDSTGRPKWNHSSFDPLIITCESKYGCILGEMPLLFPEDWDYNNDTSIGLKTVNKVAIKDRETGEIKSVRNIFFDAAIFFDLTIRESRFLFIEGLGAKCSRLDAANHIRKFVANKGVYYNI